MQRKTVLSILVVIGLVGGSALLALYGRLPGTSTTSSSPRANFTVIMSHSGFNGSAAMSPPWPILSVHRGQTVTVHLENEDPVEPHGFAIAHYLDGGVTVRPGETYTFSFVADQQGTFRVYCNIFCTVHVYMQNGQLNVG